VPPDPERVLRLRIVFALATLLTGSVAALFAAGLFGLVFSGKVGLLFAAGALPLAVGVIALILRAPLRALLATRSDHDELRSATGFVSLACGLLLLAAVAVFLVFTFSVVLAQGGALVLYVLPLVVLAYFSLQFIKEATDDFLKRTKLGREVKLFAVTLAHFAFAALVFVLLVAASTASPVVLLSPPNGSVVRAGTPLDFEVTDASVANVTLDDGTGPRPLPAPYNVSTDGWADGPYNLTLALSDSAGGAHTAAFSITIDSTAPSLSSVSPANNSIVPVGTPLNFSAADAHSFDVSWSENGTTHPLASPYSISTTGWTPGPHDLTLRATDVAGNEAALVFRINLA
jgi:hypothetical protein